MSDRIAVEVGTITVRSTKFPVTVDEYLRFHTVVGGVDVAAYDRDGLEKAIRGELARQRVEYDIPVVLSLKQEGVAVYVRARLRGAHARTGAYLFTVNDEKVSISHPTIIALEISDADLAELNRLAKVAADADNALSDFRRKVAPNAPYAAGLIRDAEKTAIAAAEVDTAV